MKAQYTINAKDSNTGQDFVLHCFRDEVNCSPYKVQKCPTYKEEIHIGPGIWIPFGHWTWGGGILTGVLLLALLAMWCCAESQVPKPDRILDKSEES